MWFIISFLSHLYGKFKNITKNLNVKLAWFSINILDGIIKSQKNVLLLVVIRMWYVRFAIGMHVMPRM